MDCVGLKISSQDFYFYTIFNNIMLVNSISINLYTKNILPN